jgi:hypothetical protein
MSFGRFGSKMRLSGIIRGVRMKNVIVDWDNYCDVIECPECIADNIDSVQKSFKDFIYEMSPVGFLYPSIKKAKVLYGENFNPPKAKITDLERIDNHNHDDDFGFDIETFVDWINKFALTNISEKTKIIKRGDSSDDFTTTNSKEIKEMEDSGVSTICF